MRQLTARQKKLLDKEMANDQNIEDWESLPYEIIKQLEAINDTEILWSETNRYIHDKRMASIYL